MASIDMAQEALENLKKVRTAPLKEASVITSAALAQATIAQVMATHEQTVAIKAQTAALVNAMRNLGQDLGNSL